MDTILFFDIFRHGATVSEDLDFFFQSSDAPPSKNAVLHRQSILNYDLWPKILRKQRELFYDSGILENRYKDYLLIAVDGSKVSLPESAALNQIFGGPLNRACPVKEKLITPQMHISTAFDPLNHQILDCVVRPYNASEIPMMMEHFERLLPFLKGKKILIMADRYYGSVEFFRWCELHGFKYLVRAKSNFFKDLRADIPEIVQDSELTVSLNTIWVRRIKNPAVQKSFQQDPKMGIRLVRNDFSFLQEERRIRKSDQTPYKTYKPVEVHAEYFTNLPSEEFSREEIIDLYHSKRWDIETNYDRLKNDLKLEQLHSRNPILIQNQIYAKIVFSNLAGAIYTLANEKLNSTKYLSNYRKIVQMLYSFISLEKIMKGKVNSSLIKKLIT